MWIPATTLVTGTAACGSTSERAPAAASGGSGGAGASGGSAGVSAGGAMAAGGSAGQASAGYPAGPYGTQAGDVLADQSDWSSHRECFEVNGHCTDADVRVSPGQGLGGQR